MNKYELMAANIERAYYEASKGQIQARVWDVKITPACVRFRFTVGAGIREKSVTGFDAELAYNLGLPAVRIVREGGEYFLEAPRDVKRQLALTDLLRNVKRVPPFTALLGVQTDSTPLLLRIDSPDIPHALLAGTTGSGKSVLLRTLLCSLALYNQPGQLQLALIDPKGRGLAPLAPLRHIWRGYGVVEDPTDAETLLGELVAEMERRDRNRRNLPRIAIAIDEFADLLDANRAVGELVQRLTQRGREAGLHVLLATQRPTATLVGSMVKANLPVRMIGKVVSPEEAKIAAGIKETGAELLQGRGDFLLIARGHIVRFQAAYALPRDLDGLVTLATTTAAAGQGRSRRAWNDLPLQLPPALPAPVAVPLPAPGQGSAAPRGAGSYLTTYNAYAGAPFAPRGAGETAWGTAPGTVPWDSATAPAESLPVDISPAAGPASLGTVPTPCPAGPAPLTDQERLDHLLPPGTYLEMRRPADERERAILALAYSVCGGRRPMCRRIYGTSPSGDVRINSRVSDWLREIGIHVGESPAPDQPDRRGGLHPPDPQLQETPNGA